MILFDGTHHSDRPQEVLREVYAFIEEGLFPDSSTGDDKKKKGKKAVALSGEIPPETPLDVIPEPFLNEAKRLIMSEMDELLESHADSSPVQPVLRARIAAPEGISGVTSAGGIFRECRWQKI